MKLDTILVGVDDSPGSRAALRFAAGLAERVGARVVAVSVFEPLAHLGDLAPGTDLRALRERAALELEQHLCAPLRDAGVTFVARVLEGRSDKALADASDTEAADLVVVGARRMSMLGGLVLGSTSMRLPALCKCPVTIVGLPRD